ncbi:hypothetical protein NUW58_g10645 [Xylaria curta]|uniref:Uncharacterized protein n=1 Tax=Xylaria curta TaxID=42375 RepID=A0ACC1MIY6_9PEZI|nr:hypothetical protein NUW58_g10645 [Xylaria curta]
MGLRHLQAVEQPRALEHKNDLVDNGADGLLLAVDNEIGLGWGLIGVIDTSEALDLAFAGSFIDTALIRLFAVFQRCSNVHEEEVAVLLDSLFGGLAVGLKGSDGGTQ